MLFPPGTNVDTAAVTAIGFILFSLIVSRSLLAEDRYAGQFRDGAWVTDAEIRDWNDAAAVPKLSGRDLFDAHNPVQWLIDRRQALTDPPPTAVEFFGGDRLAGEVIGYRAVGESPFEQQPPHLLVRPLGELQPPDDAAAAVLRVLVDGVRRVIWQRRAEDAYQPSTAYLRNGGAIAYRSARWGDGVITLLTADGVRAIPWSDLAELHFPARNVWTHYVDQLATLSPDLSSRLVTIDTADGHRCTVSNVRMQARHWGDRNRPESWLQLVQPAWALDPLWLRFRTIQSWLIFLPDEPPLSWADPQDVRRQSVFSRAWPWQRHHSTLGQRLKDRDREYVHGFGVHASTDLVFAVPPWAQSIRTQCALDPAVGSGGCVNVAVIVGQEPPLFQRQALVGAQSALDTGWLPLARDGTPAVTLRVDMANDNRPAKADPFDIRDVVNWCAPSWQLDRAALASAVTAARLSTLPGLSGWTLTSNDAQSLMTRSVFDATDGRDQRFRQVFKTTDRFVVIRRNVKIGRDDRFLSLVVSRFSENTTPSTVQVKLDGRSAGEFETPLRQGPIDPDPIVVPVHAHQGKTVAVEVVFYTPADTSLMEWRGFALTNEWPGVKPLFEDGEPLLEALQADGSIVAADRERPFSGDRCLRLSPGVVTGAQAFDPGLTVVEWPKLGQYRFLVFAWRGEGAGLTMRVAHEGRIGMQIADGLAGRTGSGRARPKNRRIEDRGLRYGFSYDIGSVKPSDAPPLRLERSVPKDWRLETRDLFGDFGMVQLTGFGLECADGGTGWFDHWYLARTPQDVELLRSYQVLSAQPKPSNDPIVVRRAQTPRDWGPMVAEFAPAFAITEAAHGLVELREHMGQAGAWQTHPHDQQRPFVLRTGMHFPSDHPLQLSMHVSHHPDRDWLLLVKANGETIHEQLINAELTRPQRGWACITVDLSRFRGQKVLLEVQNKSNDWSSEHAFWKRLTLEEP